jgi:hypothetical protein
MRRKGRKERKEGESKGKPEARTQDSPGKALRLESWSWGRRSPARLFVRWQTFGLAWPSLVCLVCSGIDCVLNQTVGLGINTSQLPRPTQRCDTYYVPTE